MIIMHVFQDKSILKKQNNCIYIKIWVKYWKRFLSLRMFFISFLAVFYVFMSYLQYKLVLQKSRPNIWIKDNQNLFFGSFIWNFLLIESNLLRWKLKNLQRLRKEIKSVSIKQQGVVTIAGTEASSKSLREYLVLHNLEEN